MEWGFSTITVAEAVIEPCWLAAVKVYLVDVTGDTLRLADWLTVPTIGLMETEVALDTYQDNVDRPPSLITAGAASKNWMTGRFEGAAGAVVAGLVAGLAVEVLGVEAVAVTLEVTVLLSLVDGAEHATRMHKTAPTTKI